MKKFTNLFLAVCILTVYAFTATAQSVGITDNGSSPNSKAMLDVSSTTKGFLPPRMSFAQLLAITAPSVGLMVWCSNCGTSGEIRIYNGTTWTALSAGPASGLPGAPTIGTARAGNAQASVSFSAPASNGGSAIISYTATSSPGGHTSTLYQAGSGTITFSGLTNCIAYTFTVTATNTTGTGVASAASNSVMPSPVIGQSYGGGLVAYILQSGDPGYISGEIHGLIAASSDQSSGSYWGCYGTTISGADGIVLGTGYQNTFDIVAGCGTAEIAARICNDLELNGYSDWYLPSKDELNKLYLNETKIGMYDGYYWSSTEYGPSYAWMQYFQGGTQTSFGKDLFARVRAVRAF